MANEKPRRHRITFNSPVVLGFVALCFLATYAGIMTGGTATMRFFATYRSPLTRPGTYVRLFTHVLGHAGWDHLVGNMVYLLLLGPLLEEKYGSRTLMRVMVITALVTGIINSVFFPRQALCGASSICFAFILLSSLTSFRDGEIPLTFILVALLFLGQEVAQGMLKSDNISNLSHVLGGVIGAVAGFGMPWANRNPAR